jgi:hypothetical protein
MKVGAGYNAGSSVSFSEWKLNGKFDVLQKVPHSYNNTVFIINTPRQEFLCVGLGSDFFNR